MFNISGIINESIVDGEGLRIVIFEQGCSHNCKGCQNPGTHEFKDKTLMSLDELMKQIELDPLIDGVTLSGGDPFFQAEENIQLIDRVKQLGLDVWAYTGFSWEEFYDYKTQGKQTANRPKITDSMIEMLEKCDIIVDGQFEISKKSLSCTFRGSTNQRIIDVQASLNRREPITKEY